MPLTQKGTVTGFSAIEKPSDKFGAATYSCKLSFTGEEAKRMKATIDGLMDESQAQHKAKGLANPPYTVANKTLTVNFKRKAEVTTKAGKHYEFDVKLFDSKGKEVEEILNIGEGTELIISYNPYLWSVQSQGGAGVTLQMDMAQVVKLVQYDVGGGGNPFSEVEGDYVAAAADVNPFTAKEEEDDMDDSDGDF